MALADLFQDFQEEIAAAGSVEQRLPAITAAGNEVQVPGAVVTMQIVPHAPENNWTTTTETVISDTIKL